MAGSHRDSRDGLSYVLRHAVEARDLHHHRGRDPPARRGHEPPIAQLPCPKQKARKAGQACAAGPSSSSGDDPEAFGRYQAHHNQTYGAAVVVTFEPLFDVDKAAEETIAALR